MKEQRQKRGEIELGILELRGEFLGFGDSESVFPFVVFPFRLSQLSDFLTRSSAPILNT
jgi:hypothetical protein